MQDMKGCQTHLLWQAKAVEGGTVGDDVAIGARGAGAVGVAAPQRQDREGGVDLTQMCQRTCRTARSGTLSIIRLTRVQLCGVQAIIWPRRRLSSVVSNRSGRVRMKAATMGFMPAGTA